MPSPRRRRRQAYHHGSLRSALLAVVGDVIGRDGLEGLSLRECARRAGVSWAAPAHHFPDKAALLTAFAVEAFERLATHISEWRDSAGTDPKRRLAATGLGYVDFALAHPAHYRVMFSGDLLRTDDAALDAAHERIRTCIAEALAACSSPSNDTEAETAAVLTWSALHGFASLFVHGVLCDGGLAPRDGRALANGLVERLLPAVLGPSRRRTTRRQRARP